MLPQFPLINSGDLVMNHLNQVDIFCVLQPYQEIT